MNSKYDKEMFVMAMIAAFLTMMFILVISRMTMDHQIELEKIRANAKQSEMFFHKLSNEPS
jgi:hypothetical protein